jgi:DNA-binding NarL/FixJ family response regulator
MIRIIIADDHAIVRGGLRQIFALVPDFSVVAEAANAREVLAQLQVAAFDLLLLDLNMPGTTGTALLARVRALHPDLPVLVLSMHNEPQLVARAIKAGANGYITKDCEPAILLAAIRKVAARGKYISPELAQNMAFAALPVASGAPHSLLSEREQEVFRRLIAGRAVHEIALDLGISSKTVSTHKVRLLEKMNLGSLVELLRYAMEHELLV